MLVQRIPQERQRWTMPRRNFYVGDMVLIVDDTAPRNSWPLGRSVEVVPDKKGLVRQVKVKTKTNELCRPVTKLWVLQESEHNGCTVVKLSQHLEWGEDK